MTNLAHENKEQAPVTPSRSPRRGRWLFGLSILLVLAAALTFGGWRYVTQRNEALATLERHSQFQPSLRVATVEANKDDVVISLPATTAAFAAANIYARASGYIDTRYADIGDQVKEGQLLAQIGAPELDDQISQAKATLGQTQAALNQAQANMELGRVTWARDQPLVKEGWSTAQQGTIDVQNLKALEAAVGVAQANLAAQNAQLEVLNQQKAYQRVVAPFDGVITQRNIDTGSLVQADATSGTFMYTIMQSHVIRTQAYVPQDHAFGLSPGVDAVIRVPEIPDRTFPGKVTRIADALQTGTRTLLTEIDVPNPDGVVQPGIYCTVELHIPRTTAALLIPSNAIIFNRDGLQVAVVKDGVADVRKISVGRDFGTTVEVREGLKPGDQVILSPPVELTSGSRVQIRAETPVASN